MTIYDSIYGVSPGTTAFNKLPRTCLSEKTQLTETRADVKVFAEWCFLGGFDQIYQRVFLRKVSFFIAQNRIHKLLLSSQLKSTADNFSEKVVK